MLSSAWLNDFLHSVQYKDFWMGPSVKFVSRINGSFSPQKIMGQLFSRKKGQTGGKGGPRGVCQKGTIFPDFFFGALPYRFRKVYYYTVHGNKVLHKKPIMETTRLELKNVPAGPL